MWPTLQSRHTARHQIAPNSTSRKYMYVCMICNIYVTTKRFAKRITFSMTSQPDPTYPSGLMILSPIKQKRDTIFLSRSKLMAEHKRNQSACWSKCTRNVTDPRTQQILRYILHTHTYIYLRNK